PAPSATCASPSRTSTRWRRGTWWAWATTGGWRGRHSSSRRPSTYGRGTSPAAPRDDAPPVGGRGGRRRPPGGVRLWWRERKRHLVAFHRRRRRPDPRQPGQPAAVGRPRGVEVVARGGWLPGGER